MHSTPCALIVQVSEVSEYSLEVSRINRQVLLISVVPVINIRIHSEYTCNTCHVIIIVGSDWTSIFFIRTSTVLMGGKKFTIK